jgi:hypothetical protein
MHVKSICSCTHIFLRNQKIKKNASWAASVAQRISDGMREYTKSQEPGLAPQPGQLFLKKRKKAKKTHPTSLSQGCQMVYFQTKNPNLAIFNGP